MSKQQKTRLGRARRNFFTGLAVVLPVIISIIVALWLFEKAGNVSKILLFPFKYIPGIDADSFKNGDELVWYWGVVAIFEAIVLTGLLGFLTRYYIGKKLVQSSSRCHLF